MVQPKGHLHNLSIATVYKLFVGISTLSWAMESIRHWVVSILREESLHLDAAFGFTWTALYGSTNNRTI